MTSSWTPSRELPLLAPEAGIGEAVRWAVAHAQLAPSELNTQPWRFRARVDRASESARVELLLDPTRVLATLDPEAREALVACGAALLDLRLGLRGAELGVVVRLAPDRATPDLLAVVEVRGHATERPEDRVLRDAIPLRASRREAFEPGTLPATLLDRLVGEGAYEGALVTVLPQEAVGELQRIDATASAREVADAEREDERATWTRANPSDADDGVPGSAYGLGLLASFAEPHRLRHGSSQVAAQELVRGRADSTVVVVGSAGRDRPSLLRTGAGLQRVLLTATAAGVSARVVNNALRFPALRGEVARLAGLDHPEVVLHLGYGLPDSTTRRRSVDDVLELTDAPLD